MNPLPLTSEQRQALETTLSRETDRLRRRAQLLLAYAEGKATAQVAAEAGCSTSQARYWRRQFLRRGLGVVEPGRVPGIQATPRPATPPPPQVPVPPDNTVSTVAASIPQATPPDLPFPTRLDRPGILSNDPLAEAGRKILRFQFAEMLRHEEATRGGEDIEALHDMRVATRRMRAAFVVFESGFDPQETRRYLKGLRAAGRALGLARDQDVFLEKAHTYQAGLPAESQAGLQPMLAAWEAERLAAHAALESYLGSKKYERFKRKFNEFVQTPKMGTRPLESEIPAATQVRDVVPALIYTRLEAVRAYEALLPAASLAQLHTLRIEFKKLRYTLEYFREVLGPEAKMVIDEIKELQDHLGDLHDADVACQIIGDFLAGWEGQQATLPLAERRSAEPMVAYLAFQHAARHRLMATFPQAWEHFNRPEVRRNLALAIAGL